jgi:hypothetical protein
MGKTERVTCLVISGESEAGITSSSRLVVFRVRKGGRRNGESRTDNCTRK